MIEKLISRRYVYRGKIVNLRLDRVRLPNHQIGMREIVEHHGAVAIVALDEKDCVLMVRQHRTGARRALWEIPAGTLEGTEPPLACAKRELHEETGMRARQWKNLGYFYSSPGFCTEKMHLFFARQLSRGHAAPEDDEFIQAKWIPFARALSMIERGDIVDGKTIVGLLRVAREFKR
jgi:ADP-ribose pyrophosphatase